MRRRLQVLQIRPWFQPQGLVSEGWVCALHRHSAGVQGAGSAAAAPPQRLRGHQRAARGRQRQAAPRAGSRVLQPPGSAAPAGAHASVLSRGSHSAALPLLRPSAPCVLPAMHHQAVLTLEASQWCSAGRGWRGHTEGGAGGGGRHGAAEDPAPAGRKPGAHPGEGLAGPHYRAWVRDTLPHVPSHPATWPARPCASFWPAACSAWQKPGLLLSSRPGVCTCQADHGIG